MTVVAIHQPNFLPWLGYFDKINRSDVFVLYDDCQMVKQSWMTRVRVIQGGEPGWISLPVLLKGKFGSQIRDISINEAVKWRRKTLASLTQNYGKAPFFQEALAVVEPVFADTRLTKLADFNHAMIQRICDALGIEARLVRASALDQTAGRATARLVSIVRALDGRTYLCGEGSDGYLEEAEFSEAGLELVYQNFAPFPYPQVGVSGFVSGLSIFDALANLGCDALGEYF